MDYIEIEDASKQSGLRAVLTAGVPGPWGEAAKGLLHVKGISYAAVAQRGGGANDALRAWTGFDNAPQLVYEDERPRIGWSEILFLVERLAPTPALIPSDRHERAAMFGLLHEVAGEGGWAWSRRLQLFHPMLSQRDKLPAPMLESIDRMAVKYGYSPEAAEIAEKRVPEILQLLSETLLAQREKGRWHLIGDTLTAADIYWATFAAMLKPLPDEDCPMGPMRAQYEITDEQTLAIADPILLEHRDRVYREHLALPLDF